MMMVEMTMMAEYSLRGDSVLDSVTVTDKSSNTKNQIKY